MPAPIVRTTIALTLALTPGLARGQSHLELHPRMGVYLSPGLLNAAYDATGAPLAQRRQLMSITFGVAATVWAARFLALDAGLTFSPSMVATTDSLHTRDATSGVVLGSLRALFGMRRRTEGWSVYGGPGIGVIHRGPAAWAAGRDAVVPALVLSAGGRLMLPGSPSFTFEVSSYSSWTDSHFEPPDAPRQRWHQDLVWSFGLAIPLARP